MVTSSHRGQPGRWRAGVLAVGLTVIVVLSCAAGARAAPLTFTGPTLIDPTGHGQFTTDIACPSQTECVVVDVFGQEVTYDPRSPGHPTDHVIVPGVGLGSITCVSDTRCVAAGSHEVVSFDPESPSSLHRFAVTADDGPSCTADECFVIGPRDVVTTFSPSHGTILRTATLARVPHVTGLACPSDHQCTTVQQFSGDEITFDPATGAAAAGAVAPYQVDPYPGPQIAGIACVSDTECAESDIGGPVAAFDPLKPETVAYQYAGDNPDFAVSGPSCLPAGGTCTVVDEDGGESTFQPDYADGTIAGAGIEEQSLGSGLDLLTVSCVAGPQCVAIDQRGNSVAFAPTITAANVEGPSTPVDTAGSLQAISCAPGECSAVDSDGDAVFFPTAAPGSSTVIALPGFEAFGDGNLDVACPSATLCAATEDLADGTIVAYDPRSPASVTSTQIADESASLYGITCPSLTECVATGDSDSTGNGYQGFAWTFDPASPAMTDPQLVDAGQGLTAVACPSATQCSALEQRVGDDQTTGDVVTFDPLTPSAPASTPVKVDPHGDADAITCVSTSQCTIVDAEGAAVTFDPDATSPPKVRYVATTALDGVSCLSAHECIATARPTAAVTFDPIGATAPGSQTLARSSDPLAVSCTPPTGSRATCAIVDAIGQLYLAATSTSTPSRFSAAATATGTARRRRR